MIPDNVEKIIMTKEDYDRQVEQMLLEKLEAEQRIEKAINKVQDIIDIGFDYDGYSDVKNLKILIDELVDLARETKNILNCRSDE